MQRAMEERLRLAAGMSSGMENQEGPRLLGFAKEGGRRASDTFSSKVSPAPEFLKNRDHTSLAIVTPVPSAMPGHSRYLVLSPHLLS